MADAAVPTPARRRLLLVEDEYLVAADLAWALEQARAEIVGSAGSVADALELVRDEGDRLDSAVLDINLGGERVFPVADALTERGVPFIFATGHDASIIPPAYASTPRHEKPVDRVRLLRELAGLVPG